jgi:uncharacterized cupredoxin-like copper-binding protein
MVRRMAVLLGVVLTLAMAGGLAGQAAPSPTPRPIAVTITVTHQAEFTFAPREVRVTAGRPVTITLVNNGRLPHDLHISDLKVAIPPLRPDGQHQFLAPAKRASVTFTPTRRGRFEFICTVPGHKEAGMRGVLIVR